MDCLFCKIVEGKIPCEKIGESKSFIAFLDISPSSQGHTLIVPKKHSVNFMDLSHQMGSEFVEFTQATASKVLHTTGADGFNLVLNNGANSGQLVFHTHFHIIPRKKDDGLKISFEKHLKVSPEELKNLASQIRGE